MSYTRAVLFILLSAMTFSISTTPTFATDGNEPAFNGSAFTLFPVLTPATKIRLTLVAPCHAPGCRDVLRGGDEVEVVVTGRLRVFPPEATCGICFDSFFDIDVECRGRVIEGGGGADILIGGGNIELPDDFEGVAHGILILDDLTIGGKRKRSRQVKPIRFRGLAYVSPTPSGSNPSGLELVPYSTEVGLLLPAVNAAREDR